MLIWRYSLRVSGTSTVFIFSILNDKFLHSHLWRFAAGLGAFQTMVDFLRLYSSRTGASHVFRYILKPFFKWNSLASFVICKAFVASHLCLHIYRYRVCDSLFGGNYISFRVFEGFRVRCHELRIISICVHLATSWALTYCELWRSSMTYNWRFLKFCHLWFSSGHHLLTHMFSFCPRQCTEIWPSVTLLTISIGSQKLGTIWVFCAQNV